MQWFEAALKQIPNETFHEEREKFHCYNESVESKKLVQLFFFMFVIMQVVLLKVLVCLGQRWNAVMKSRLIVT